ncbi:MAG TPA: right-handed parallel beta-helix repeat-containing protein, partial [Candidatus Angelobacter sp.]|nr:right-handed parallel beta-helix repeat-containing protein [Candidatus Angelobacter sp.]
SNVAKADGIFVLGATPDGEHSHDITIAGNTMTGVKDTSIEVGDGSQKVTVTGNKITLSQAPDGSSGSTGISVRSAQDVRVAGNTVIGDLGEHGQVGLLVWSPAKDQGGPLSEVTLEDNTVFTIGGDGIKVHTGNAIHIIRNTVRHSAQNNILITEKATEVTKQGNVLE